MSSEVVAATARYSASAEDVETVFCFFDFQEISASPKNTQNPVMERLVVKQVPQSASEKARRFVEEEEEKCRPSPGCPLDISQQVMNCL